MLAARSSTGLASRKASTSRKEAVCVKATAQPAAPTKPDSEKPFIHLIPNNGKWANGIPAVMGAHLMASGIVAPVSVSKGPGIDVTPHQFQYHTTESEVGVVLHTTAANAAKGIVKSVVDAYGAAVKAKGSFTLVLSGGSLLSNLSGLAAAKGIDWSKVHVFYVDERNVPHSSADSNHKGAVDSFLGKVAIPAENVFAIHEGLPVDGAALNYEGRLYGLPSSVLPRSEAGYPVFDLVLLGVGPDGHVASLFPNRPELAPTSRWVLPIANSPKPPPERITFTLPVINAAKEVHVVALGESKAEIVQRALEVQALPGALPAQLVRPATGKVTWVLDVAAAQHLDIAAWGDSKQYPRSS